MTKRCICGDMHCALCFPELRAPIDASGVEPTAKLASEEVEREGLGAFLDGCPSSAFSTVDDSPTLTRFVFEDGSVMVLRVASVSWRTS